MVTSKSVAQTERKGLALRANFSWTFAGNLVYAVSQWAMLTVLAKLGTPKMVGQFALGLAIATPVITFTNLALRQAQATDARAEYHFGDYLALRLIMTLLALTIIAGIAVAGYTSQPQTMMVILMMGLAKACEANWLLPRSVAPECLCCVTALAIWWR